MKILYAVSELYPLIKTGGLADVAYNLPHALHRLGHRVVIILPAYQPLRHLLTDCHSVFRITCLDLEVDVREYTEEGLGVPVWLVDCPEYFDREGGPYSDYYHRDWNDNALRFGLFCHAIAEVVVHSENAGHGFDVVHCNDWQTGLAPVLLTSHCQAENCQGPNVVFTIHNLAYQGVFPRKDFDELKLPDSLWDFTQLEFHGSFSFMKGGVVHADHVTTVSPGYAREVLTEAFGCGLDGVLRYYSDKFIGIINGIDRDIWNPGTDGLITNNYTVETLANNRSPNKVHLNRLYGMPPDDKTLTVGFIGRLVEQKGVDLLIAALESMAELPMRLVVLGSGDEAYEDALLSWRDSHGDKIGLCFHYDESLAHNIVAGADVLLVPSRYEPCGLVQMYAMTYGCIPIAHAVGGLKDTIVDVGDPRGGDVHGSGLLFDEYSPQALVEAIQKALALYANKEQWRWLQANAMAADFSWEESAKAYQKLYQGQAETRSEAINPPP